MENFRIYCAVFILLSGCTQADINRVNQSLFESASPAPETSVHDAMSRLNAGLAAAAHNQATQCGITPIAPIGCDTSGAQCICSPSGECAWQFINCGQ